MNIVSRYAKALFEAAVEKKVAEKILMELMVFEKLIKENKELKSFLFTPAIPLSLRLNVLKKIFKKTKFLNLTSNFILYLIKKGRFEFLSEIIINYQNLLDEKAHRLRAKIKTAVPLSPRLKNKLEQQLKAFFGKKIMAEYLVEPELIGGVVTEVGNYIFDGSIKNYLKNIQERR